MPGAYNIRAPVHPPAILIFFSFVTMPGIKRRRTAYGAKPARPIDKRIIVVKESGIGGGVTEKTLFTASGACTLVGVRWQFYSYGDAGTGGNAHDLAWMLVIVRDGQSVGTVSVADGQSLYEPEQDVLAWGVTTSGANSMSAQLDEDKFDGLCKTMRKLKSGDQLALLLRGTNTDTSAFGGACQFFCME